MKASDYHRSCSGRPSIEFGRAPLMRSKSRVDGSLLGGSRLRPPHYEVSAATGALSHGARNENGLPLSAAPPPRERNLLPYWRPRPSALHLRLWGSMKSVHSVPAFLSGGKGAAGPVHNWGRAFSRLGRRIWHGVDDASMDWRRQSSICSFYLIW